MRAADARMRRMNGARGALPDRVDPGGVRIALAIAATCVLHVGVLILLAREPAVRGVTVQRRVMVATLIAPAPAVPTAAAAAANSRAASHATHRTVSAPRSPMSSKLPTIQPAAPDRTRPPARDAAAPSPPVPSATASERSVTPHDDAHPDTRQARSESQTSPAPATPRFVAHPDCALATPGYPPQSLRTGEHGTVLVELVTDAAGRVVAARVVTGSGFPRLDAAARDAVLESRCAAQVENGTPLPMRARVPITFTLDE